MMGMSGQYLFGILVGLADAAITLWSSGFRPAALVCLSMLVVGGAILGVAEVFVRLGVFAYRALGRHFDRKAGRI